MKFYFESNGLHWAITQVDGSTDEPFMIEHPLERQGWHRVRDGVIHGCSIWLADNDYQRMCKDKYFQQTITYAVHIAKQRF